MPLSLECATCGPLGNNVYLWFDRASSEAMLIDPGIDSDALAAEIRKKNLNLKYIVNTHGHFDHTFNNRYFKNEFPEAMLLIHRADEHMLRAQTAMAAMFQFDAESSPAPDDYLAEGGVLYLGAHQFEILEVPGHSQGSVAIVCGEDAVVGDALFAGSIGRTDLPGGDTETLLASIRGKLLTLPDGTRIHPGHGPATTVLRERISNPYLI
ncbi:MAG: MBL fold metallo-hydrolase [bacterium]|jgi:glyoxylase-like metal-dependent hydrolase (beta-lactamase superfamily II)